MQTVALQEARDAAPTETRCLATRAAEDGVGFLLATFVDMVGKPCSKLVPVESVDLLEAEGVGFAGYAAGLLGQHPSDPDVVARPDLSSYTPLPFVRPGLALVHCDPYVDGERWPYAPRVILRGVLDRLATRGLAAQAGVEAEYFLVRRDSAGSIVTADDHDRSASPCYDARALTRMYDHLTEVSAAVNALGWTNYANDHEDANGQFEQNFLHADPMTTADRLITFRYLVQVIAERRGMTATFMPKPFTGRTGTGLHIHLSLWDGPDPTFPDAADPRRLGLSLQAYRFIAGLLDHAPALQAVLGPTVNSYKRTGPPTAGAPTWAPNAITYGGNDRSHLLRVPADNRVEVRACDGSANPYLAMAALLTAGLDGIDRGLNPGDPPGGTGAVMPPTLLHAVEALQADPVVRGALDILAPDGAVSGYFADAKRREFLAWHSQVTAAEINQYLTAF